MKSDKSKQKAPDVASVQRLVGQIDAEVTELRTEVRTCRERIRELLDKRKRLKARIPHQVPKNLVDAKPRRMQMLHAVARGQTYTEVARAHEITAGRVRQIVLSEWRRSFREHYLENRGDVRLLRENPLPND